MQRFELEVINTMPLMLNHDEGRYVLYSEAEGKIAECDHIIYALLNISPADRLAIGKHLRELLANETI